MTDISDPSLPTDDDITLAREGRRLLSDYLQRNPDARQIEILDAQGQTQTLHLPRSALALLLKVLGEIGEGHAVDINSFHAELTTQEAADALNVSRPFLVRLLEQGQIPFHRVGSHRRVHYRDVIAYKERIDAERRKALDALAEQAQSLGMGYE